MENPLSSLAAYSQFLAEVVDRPSVESSTVRVWPASPHTGVAEGEVLFRQGLRLRMREELNFRWGEILTYGYEVYRRTELIHRYDDFPHPDDADLASTLPHHKHIQPDPRHNRVPAPGLSFNCPNLPLIIAEIEALL